MKVIAVFLFLFISVGVQSSEILNSLRVPGIILVASKLVPENVVEKNAVGHLMLQGVNKPRIDVERIGVSSIFRIKMDGKAYLTDDSARFWMPYGPIKQMSPDGIYQTTSTQKEIDSIIGLLSFIDIYKDEMVIYPANGKRKHKVYAFMDVSCPYCQKFHRTELRGFRNKGVELVYVPLLRNVNDKKVRKMTNALYCLPKGDKQAAMDGILTNFKYEKNRLLGIKGCSSNNQWVYDLLMNSGQRHGFSGSPVFITENGRVFYGASGLTSFFK
tara:strand:- start:867 stop:1682 length:816 start_codon:yes stop_codon:yes gene_type:complete